MINGNFVLWLLNDERKMVFSQLNHLNAKHIVYTTSHVVNTSSQVSFEGTLLQPAYWQNVVELNPIKVPTSDIWSKSLIFF